MIGLRLLSQQGEAKTLACSTSMLGHNAGVTWLGSHCSVTLLGPHCCAVIAMTYTTDLSP